MNLFGLTSDMSIVGRYLGSSLIFFEFLTTFGRLIPLFCHFYFYLALFFSFIAHIGMEFGEGFFILSEEIVVADIDIRATF